MRVFQTIFREIRWFISHTSLRALPRVSRAVSHQARIYWTLIFVTMFSVTVVILYFLITNFLSMKTFFETTTERRKTPFPSVTICPHRPFSSKSEGILKGNTPYKLASDYTKWRIMWESESSKGLPLPYPSYAHYFQLFNLTKLKT